MQYLKSCIQFIAVYANLIINEIFSVSSLDTPLSISFVLKCFCYAFCRSYVLIMCSVSEWRLRQQLPLKILKYFHNLIIVVNYVGTSSYWGNQINSGCSVLCFKSGSFT